MHSSTKIMFIPNMHRVAEDAPVRDKKIMILQRGVQISLGARLPGLECWPDYSLSV